MLTILFNGRIVTPAPSGGGGGGYQAGRHRLREERKRDSIVEPEEDFREVLELAIQFITCQR